MSIATLWPRHAHTAPGAPSTTARTRARARARALTVAVAFVAGLLVAPAQQAQAAVPGISAPMGASALALTAKQKGIPYRYGGTTPKGFDCSGLVLYVYNTKLKRKVPRTAEQQYRATIRVAKNKMRPGDLVFLRSGGTTYHVGIYAGGNKMWHAPKPGDRVKLATIWTSQWVGGRVR